jgi:uncharacterized protein YgiM (DUF1202 family)
VTSFYNDPDDGKYWPSHYMGANRPWTGASVGSVVPTAPATGSTNVTKTQPITTQIPQGATSAVVTAPGGLNVRTSPSKSATRAAVASTGSTVYVLGQSGAWSKVQLPNGVTGWVMTMYISTGATTSNTRPVAPAKASQPAVTSQKGLVASKVAALNVHSGASTSSAVIGSLVKGEKVVVLARKGDMVEIRLPNGTTGWVAASYLKGNGITTTNATASGANGVSTAAKTSTSAKTTTSGVAVHVRQSPSLNAGIVATLSKGGSYTILGWSNNWAHVRLSNGTTGWISGTVIGAVAKTGTTSYSSVSHTTKATSKTSVNKSYYPHLITAGVRVHATASLKGRVVGGATAGTRARVLGYANGFAHVQLSNGISGWVYGTYVR